MKARVALKLIVLGTLIVLGLNWLKGYDVLTAIALSLPLLLVIAKCIFHFLQRRNGGHDGDAGGPLGSGRPIPIPPVRPVPREFSSLPR